MAYFHLYLTSPLGGRRVPSLMFLTVNSLQMLPELSQLCSWWGAPANRPPLLNSPLQLAGTRLGGSWQGPGEAGGRFPCEDGLLLCRVHDMARFEDHVWGPNWAAERFFCLLLFVVLLLKAVLLWVWHVKERPGPDLQSRQNLVKKKEKRLCFCYYGTCEPTAVATLSGGGRRTSWTGSTSSVHHICLIVALQ